MWLLQRENQGSVGGGVAGWPLLDPVSQKMLCPMLRRAAVPALCYQCTIQRGLWGEIVIREDSLLSQRLQHFPKEGMGSADDSFPYFSSSHHCSALYSGYRLLFGKSFFISCGRWWLPSSHSHLLWIPLQLLTSGNIHPGSSTISHLCSAMLSLEVSNTVSIWGLQSTSMEEDHTPPCIN